MCLVRCPVNPAVHSLFIEAESFFCHHEKKTALVAAAMPAPDFMSCLKCLACCGFALGVIGPLYAHDLEQDVVRHAVQAGEALPFQMVRERVSRYCSGCEVLQAKLHEEKEDGRRFLIYDIKALAADGRVIKLELNAATGEILKVKHKGFAH